MSYFHELSAGQPAPVNLYSSGNLIYTSGATVSNGGIYETTENNDRYYVSAAGAGLLSGALVAVIHCSGGINVVMDYQPAISGGYAVISGLRPFRPNTERIKGLTLNIGGDKFAFIPDNADKAIERENLQRGIAAKTNFEININGTITSKYVSSQIYSGDSNGRNYSDDGLKTVLFTSGGRAEFSESQKQVYSNYENAAGVNFATFSATTTTGAGAMTYRTTISRGYTADFRRTAEHPNGRAFIYLSSAGNYRTANGAINYTREYRESRTESGITSSGGESSSWTENKTEYLSTYNAGDVIATATLVSGGYTVPSQQVAIPQQGEGSKTGITGNNVFYTFWTLPDGSRKSIYRARINNSSQYETYIDPAGVMPTAQRLYSSTPITSVIDYSSVGIIDKRTVITETETIISGGVLTLQ